MSLVAFSAVISLPPSPSFPFSLFISKQQCLLELHTTTWRRHPDRLPFGKVNLCVETFLIFRFATCKVPIVQSRLNHILYPGMSNSLPPTNIFCAVHIRKQLLQSSAKNTIFKKFLNNLSSPYIRQKRILLWFLLHLLLHNHFQRSVLRFAKRTTLLSFIKFFNWRYSEHFQLQLAQ